MRSERESTAYLLGLMIHKYSATEFGMSSHQPRRVYARDFCNVAEGGNAWVVAARLPMPNGGMGNPEVMGKIPDAESNPGAGLPDTRADPHAQLPWVSSEARQ